LYFLLSFCIHKTATLKHLRALCHHRCGVNHIHYYFWLTTYYL